MRRRPVSSHRSPEPTSRSSYVFLLWRGKDATSEHLAEAWSLTGYCASDLQSQLHAGVKDLLARFRPITIEEIRALGGQLAGGAVVAFAVLLLERLAEDRFRRSEQLREDRQREEDRKRAEEREKDERRRREEEEERNFRLLIGLQQDLTGIDLEKRDLRSYFLRAKNMS